MTRSINTISQSNITRDYSMQPALVREAGATGPQNQVRGWGCPREIVELVQFVQHWIWVDFSETWR